MVGARETFQPCFTCIIGVTCMSLATHYNRYALACIICVGPLVSPSDLLIVTLFTEHVIHSNHLHAYACFRYFYVPHPSPSRQEKREER